MLDDTVGPTPRGEEDVAIPLPALRTPISEIVAARDAAIAEVDRAAGLLEDAYATSQAAVAFAQKAHMGNRFYVGMHDKTPSYTALFNDRFDRAAAVEAFRRRVDADTWTRLVEVTGIERLMDREERERFREELAGDVPAVTEANLQATFDRLTGEAELIYLRGLARVFAKLDRRFRSHDDRFKFGTRIILTRLFDDHGWFNYHGPRDDLADVDRALEVLSGGTGLGATLIDRIEEARAGSFGARQQTYEHARLRMRGFKNGNAHLWIKDAYVKLLNKALAKYYGEVLADAAPRGDDAESWARRSNLPVRDLAFYPTPEAAATEMLARAGSCDGLRVLEPSAGTGALVAPLLAKGARVDAIEIHPDRVRRLEAMQATAPTDALTVTQANFLDRPPIAIYNLVVMNPPFAGTHYMDHVRHGWEFVKPGGMLLAILPASAEVNETPKHLMFQRWIEAEQAYYGSYDCGWRDLPMESFAASGTRIATVTLKMRKPT